MNIPTVPTGVEKGGNLGLTAKRRSYLPSESFELEEKASALEPNG